MQIFLCNKKRDNLITEFRDPKIHACSTESHFNKIQLSEITFSLLLNLCKLAINNQEDFVGKWILFARTREAHCKNQEFSCRYLLHHCTNFLSSNSKKKSSWINIWIRGKYDSIAGVGKTGVWLRANFQSGSRVLKKVFWTFSYLYLWHTMWFHAKKLLKTLNR